MPAYFGELNGLREDIHRRKQVAEWLGLEPAAATDLHPKLVHEAEVVMEVTRRRERERQKREAFHAEMDERHRAQLRGGRRR